MFEFNKFVVLTSTYFVYLKDAALTLFLLFNRFGEEMLKREWIIMELFLNGPFPASFHVYFGLLKQTLQFHNDAMWKNVHPGFEPTAFWTRVSSHNH